ncbi:MAG: universal stress protein [Sphingobacterium sp.]|jgi:nucleotide-binding universal stress UspA family protein|nr:universal stress protein [Sphingobacterium sp.]
MALISKILIAVDRSPLSEKVIEYGYFIARQIHAAIGIIVVDTSTENPSDTLVGYVNSLSEEIQSDEAEFLRAMKDKYADDIPTELFLIAGPITDSILDTAETWGAQIIVAGKPSHKALSRLFTGSTSDDLIHATDVPLLLVPLAKTDQ